MGGLSNGPTPIPRRLLTPKPGYDKNPLQVGAKRLEEIDDNVNRAHLRCDTMNNCTACAKAPNK